jgi:hypothetical protein
LPVECSLARYSDEPCDGSVHRIHLIPGSVVRQRVGLHAVWDHRVLTHACVTHHAEHDLGLLSPPRAELPSAVEAFAAQHGMTEVLDGLYGVRP